MFLLLARSIPKVAVMFPSTSLVLRIARHHRKVHRPWSVPPGTRPGPMAQQATAETSLMEKHSSKPPPFPSKGSLTHDCACPSDIPDKDARKGYSRRQECPSLVNRQKRLVVINQKTRLKSQRCVHRVVTLRFLSHRINPILMLPPNRNAMKIPIEGPPQSDDF
jgi:hypothetical protein